jgi:hypothetical protein
METFDKLIRTLPKELKVLDVGVAGHEGENTSCFLVKYFSDVTGITIRSEKEVAWDAYPVIRDDFYKHKFKEKFDLIVLDLNIDNNIGRDWTTEGLGRISKLLNPNGYLINYVMMTDNYGDPETPALIRKHAKKWWGELTDEAVRSKLSTLDIWRLISCERESRRPEILWILLQRK